MVFQERTYSVLVVSASDKFNSSIMALLPVTDYWPVNIAKSISEAKRKLLDTPVDILLINAPLTDDQGRLKAEYTIEGMHIYEEGYRAIWPLVKAAVLS